MDYSSSIDEDKEEEVKITNENEKEEDIVSKKDVGVVNVILEAKTPSMPIVTTTPSTPPPPLVTIGNISLVSL